MIMIHVGKNPGGFLKCFWYFKCADNFYLKYEPPPALLTAAVSSVIIFILHQSLGRVNTPQAFNILLLNSYVLWIPVGAI